MAAFGEHLTDNGFDHADPITSKKPTHCFAQSVHDGRYVLIRLISKGPDGHEELAIQRYISSGAEAFRGDNHCLRMERELSFDDMTFGVFAVLSEGFRFPRYGSLKEVFESVDQLLEVEYRFCPRLDLKLIHNLPGARISSSESDRTSRKFSNSPT
jgi:hypothetical protein